MTKLVPCARACVVFERKILLVSTDGSYWHLPGGHLEPREDLKTCAKREVYEETGYDVTIGDMIYCFELYDHKWDSHKVECCFAASVLRAPEQGTWQDLGHDQSITQVRWFSLEEVQSRQDIYPFALKDGRWLDAPTVAVYQGYDEMRRR